jgi:hypothetical protein
LQCKSKVEVGGIVDMVLLEGGFLFVGLHIGEGDGLIKVWNTATGAEQSLSGPKVCGQGCAAILRTKCIGMIVAAGKEMYPLRHRLQQSHRLSAYESMLIL